MQNKRSTIGASLAVVFLVGAISFSQPSLAAGGGGCQVTSHSPFPGSLLINYGCGNDSAKSCSVKPDGRINLGGTAEGSGTSIRDFGFAEVSATGSLNWATRTAMSKADDFGFALAALASGKFILGGTYYNSTDIMTRRNGWAWLRANSSGSLDTSYSGDGKVTLTANGSMIRAMVEQSADVMIAVGHYKGTFALARITAAGVIDTTFGAGCTICTRVDGIVTVPMGTALSIAFGVALDGQGRIVIEGQTNWQGGAPHMVVARFLADGTNDSTFGSGGVVAVPTVSGEGGSIAVQPDLKIVAGGSGGSDFKIVRLLSDGSSVDPTFASSGIATVDFGGSDTASSIAIQADGKILATGPTGGIGLPLVRLDANGGLELAVLTPIAGNGTGGCIAASPSDQIVIGGWAKSNGVNDDMTVLRFDQSGTLDTNFHK